MQAGIYAEKRARACMFRIPERTFLLEELTVHRRMAETESRCGDLI
jgi:hypothetical protein